MQFLLLIYTDETAWSSYSRAEQQGILAGHAKFRAEAQAAFEEIYGLVPTFARKHALGEVSL